MSDERTPEEMTSEESTLRGSPAASTSGISDETAPAVRAERASKPPSELPEREPASVIIRDMMSSNGVLVAASILLALLIGALLVAFFNADVARAAGYLFARPGDFFSAAGGAMGDYFTSLFRGAIFDYQARNWVGMIRPITETMTNATPLILAGLAVGVAFRGGLFNIGGQGQLIVGAIAASWVGFTLSLPPFIHMLVAMIAAAMAGAIWGLIVGILKARVNSNEVILTIMLNFVAAFLLQYLIKKPSFTGPGGFPGKSMSVDASAAYPMLLGGNFRLHGGFIVALLMALLVWWLMERSTLGFKIRAVGANSSAAHTAGISVPIVIMATMAIAGALAGLAGTAPALGTEKFLTVGVAANYGFDALTVALLGRSKPRGIVLAGLLFGAMNAGGSLMQAAANIPVDIVQVSQAIIVLLIAAPPLVRWILRLPAPRDRYAEPAPVKAQPKEVVA